MLCSICTFEIERIRTPITNNTPPDTEPDLDPDYISLILNSDS